MPWKLNDHTTSLISLTIAGLAVVLSQFPPIYTYFQSEEIEIGSNSEIHLRHHFGNLGISKRVTLKNTGEASGEIEKVGLFLARRDDVENGLLFPARFYYAQERQTLALEQPQLPIVEFFLQPSTSWDHHTVFYRRLEFSQEQNYRELQREIIREREIWEWEAVNELGLTDEELFEYEDAKPMRFSDELSAEIQKFIKQQLSWLETGPYVLVEFVIHDNETAASFFEFEVSDSTLEALEEISAAHNFFLDPFSSMPKGIFESLRPFQPAQAERELLLNSIQSAYEIQRP